jgi:hypothetical protein
MAWYGFHVEIDGLGDKHATAAHISQWAKTAFPHALNVCQPLTDPPDHTAEFHCTALYYGKENEDKLRAAQLERRLDPAVPLCGTVREVHAVGPIKSYDGSERYYVCLAYDCEPLQEYFLLLKSEAERVTGSQIGQRPHLGPAGERCFKNDVNPHSTLATYDSKSALDADFGAMDPAITRIDFFANISAQKRAVRLVDLHVNIKQ